MRDGRKGVERDRARETDREGERNKIGLFSFLEQFTEYLTKTFGTYARPEMISILVYFKVFGDYIIFPKLILVQ